MKAWFAGLSVVAGLVALVGWLVPDEQVRRPMWLFIFAVLAASSVFAWSHPEAPTTPAGWLGYIAMAFFGAAVFLGIDVLFFVRAPAGTSFKDVALNSGAVVFDLIAIGGGAIVAIGGWAYSMARKPRAT